MDRQSKCSRLSMPMQVIHAEKWPRKRLEGSRQDETLDRSQIGKCNNRRTYTPLQNISQGLVDIDRLDARF